MSKIEVVLSDSHHAPDSVLEEWRVALATAKCRLERVNTGFSRGDSTRHELEELTQSIQHICARHEQFPGKLPEGMQQELRDLITGLAATASQGEHWMVNVATPQLARSHQTDRLRRAYRLHH